MLNILHFCSRTLRKVVQVLHRLVGQMKYNVAKKPWMVPINTVIDDLRAEAEACVEAAYDVADDLLERELKVDLYHSYLVRDQPVTLVRLNRLIYLRRLVFHSPDAIAPFEVLRRAVAEHTRLLPADTRERLEQEVFQGQKRGLANLAWRQQALGIYLDDWGVMAIATAAFLQR